MTLETVKRRVDNLEQSMGGRDVPRLAITLVYVEAADGKPTGRVTVVEPDRPPREEWQDPAMLRAGVSEP